MVLAIRSVTDHDILIVAGMNQRLIEDEGSRNPMSMPELAERLRGWLREGLRGDLVLDGDAIVGDAVYTARRDEHDPTLPEIYIRCGSSSSNIPRGDAAWDPKRSDFWSAI